MEKRDTDSPAKPKLILSLTPAAFIHNIESVENDEFLKIIRAEFDDNRLTYQKRIPTFHPESAEEAARLMALARRHRQKLFVAGYGNIIAPEGDRFGDRVTIKSDRQNSLVEIAPGDFYVVVQAGYPLMELNPILKEHGLFLPHADLPYVGSVGGALAAGLCGTHQEHELPIGRYLLMAQIAVPEGKLIAPGSACFKSVSGFDIVKIFSPSWGLLGMIVTATLRVLPLTARTEYHDFVMRPLDYRPFADLYRNPGDNQNARYSIKIKNKFDPDNILPLVET